VFVELPLPFDNVKDRIRFGIEGAMDAELVSEGDEVVCIASVFDGGSDAVIRVTVDETVHTGIYDLFVNSRAEPSVIRDVFEVAIELGQKGQKGKPVGVLFVVGDAGKVMNKSRPLSYNPFEKSHVHVGDPIVNVMLKEFSRLDGAFVVSDSGRSSPRTATSNRVRRASIFRRGSARATWRAARSPGHERDRDRPLRVGRARAGV